jgi:hypothetical protein
MRWIRGFDPTPAPNSEIRSRSPSRRFLCDASPTDKIVTGAIMSAKQLRKRVTFVRKRFQCVLFEASEELFSEDLHPFCPGLCLSRPSDIDDFKETPSNNLSKLITPQNSLMIHPRPNSRDRRSIHGKPIRHRHNTRSRRIIRSNRIIESSARDGDQGNMPKRIIVCPFRSISTSPVRINGIIDSLHFPIEWGWGDRVRCSHGDNRINGIREVIRHGEHGASDDSAHTMSDDDDGLRVWQACIMRSSTSFVI